MGDREDRIRIERDDAPVVKTNSRGRRYVDIGDLMRQESVRNEIKRQANIGDAGGGHAPGVPAYEPDYEPAQPRE